MGNQIDLNLSRFSFTSLDCYRILSLLRSIAFNDLYSFIPTLIVNNIQFSSVAQSCSTLCIPMNYSTPGFPVYHHLPELAQTHVHRVIDTIQPSHPLSFPSLPTFNLSQQQGLLQWVSSLHQVAKVLELYLQPQSSQWIFRTDFLWIDSFDLLAETTASEKFSFCLWNKKCLVW